MHKSKILFFLLFVLSFTVSCNLYNINKTAESREKILNYPDSILKFSVNTLINRKAKIDINLSYYWLNIDKVNMNVGGYGGYLLHGSYLVYDHEKHSNFTRWDTKNIHESINAILYPKNPILE